MSSTYTPDLSPYYGDLSTETNYVIQAKRPTYGDVGKGSFSALSTNQISFQGSIDFIYQGDVDLDISVTGENSGRVSFNGNSEDCTFSTDDDTLIVHLNVPGKGQTTLEVEWWHGGLWVGGPGTPHNIWVGDD